MLQRGIKKDQEREGLGEELLHSIVWLGWSHGEGEQSSEGSKGMSMRISGKNIAKALWWNVTERFEEETGGPGGSSGEGEW